jgi:hypothetical protein
MAGVPHFLFIDFDAQAGAWGHAQSAVFEDKGRFQKRPAQELQTV